MLLSVLVLAAAGGALGAGTSQALIGVGAPPLLGGDDDPTPPRKIALVGDSLLVGAEDEIVAALPPGIDATFDGENGRRIAERQPAATALASADPDAMVIVLGANDLNDRTADEIERDIASMLDSVADVPCVRWVTVQQDFYLDGMEEAEGRARVVNLTLFREAEKRPEVDVADFAPIIGAQPTWHRMDLLHLDDRGDRALAQVVAESLETC
jgi:hypothetical protein